MTLSCTWQQPILDTLLLKSRPAPCPTFQCCFWIFFPSFELTCPRLIVFVCTPELEPVSGLHRPLPAPCRILVAESDIRRFSPSVDCDLSSPMIHSAESFGFFFGFSVPDCCVNDPSLLFCGLGAALLNKDLKWISARVCCFWVQSLNRDRNVVCLASRHPGSNFQSFQQQLQSAAKLTFSE